MKTCFQIKIGGSAGEGIKVSGLILCRALSRLGYYIFGYNEYPSLIRGGHNAYQINAGIDKVFSQVRKVDILVALNQETIKLHQNELTAETFILYDPDEFKLPKKPLIGKYIAIKLIHLAENSGGKAIMANMVSLGAVLALLGLTLDSLNQVIEKQFNKKGADIIKLNQKSAKAGSDFILDQFKRTDKKKNSKFHPEKPKKNKELMILTGNEAISLGAIAGGLQFYPAYPMTPATSILHYLAVKSKQTGILVKHVEDEISAINMAIGAGFAGVKSMTATSGGGLCLMAEGASLAGISETPVVIVNAMRPGPGIGIPTGTAQGDLQFVLYIGHDEFPRIVLTPGDSEEAFHLTKFALELAEKYQLPVFILVDKYLSESDFSPDKFDFVHKNQRLGFIKKSMNRTNKPFKRYLLTKNGISMRSIPGQKGGIHCCNSYEHDEFGYGSEEGNTRTLMMDKRMKKLELIKNEIPEQPVFGPEKSKISIISWGSNKGPILEALKTFKQANFLHLNFIWPFPESQITKFIQNSEKVICIECNSTGQLANIIREQTGIELENLLKYNGMPFWPEEIVKELKNSLST